MINEVSPVRIPGNVWKNDLLSSAILLSKQSFSGHSGSLNSVRPLTNQDQPKAHNANASSQNTGLIAEIAVSSKKT